MFEWPCKITGRATENSTKTVYTVTLQRSYLTLESLSNGVFSFGTNVIVEVPTLNKSEAKCSNLAWVKCSNLPMTRPVDLGSSILNVIFIFPSIFKPNIKYLVPIDVNWQPIKRFACVMSHNETPWGSRGVLVPVILFQLEQLPHCYEEIQIHNMQKL